MSEYFAENKNICLGTQGELFPQIGKWVPVSSPCWPEFTVSAHIVMGFLCVWFPPQSKNVKLNRRLPGGVSVNVSVC